MAILLKNATLVTMDKQQPLKERQQLVIDQGTIADFGDHIKSTRFAIEDCIDCSGKIVMPGLVNAHSHLTEILQKSFRDNVRMEIWREYRSRTEEMAHLGAEEIEAAAQLACGEMLKNGVTAVVDHFSTRPGLSVVRMQAILDAFEKTGIRGVLTPSLRDQDFLSLLGSRSAGRKAPKGGEQKNWRDDVLAVLDRIKGSSGISNLMLGPTSPLNCSDSMLHEVVDVAEEYDLGIHTHLLETNIQRFAARKLYNNKKMCEHLGKIGFFSPRVSAAHCIWLDEREMDIFASSHASVVHCPASNLKLGSGIAPIVKLKNRSVNIALGSDGGDTSDSYSIFEQMRLAAFLSRVTVQNPALWVTASDALSMGTVNGAQAIPAWRGKIGRIKTGYRADLLILKPHLRLYPLNDVIHQLVFCEGGQSVDTVLVDGKIVVREGRLTQVSEETLARKVGDVSKKMYRTYHRIRKRATRKELAFRELYEKVAKSGKPSELLDR
jgi:cytosine/adenosine deaminase-related metal-dependent hydrolase